MQNTIACTAALGLAFIAAPVAAMAGDEVKFTLNAYAVGTYKGDMMAKAGLISIFDETGFAESQDKLFDHVTSHCVGSYTEVAGKASWTGHCLMTDPAGDQYICDIQSDGPYDPKSESHAAKGIFVSGTGKFAGITGSWTHVNHQGGFKVSAERTYVNRVNMTGTYKLP
jgi:hypothetical protein